MSSASGHFSAGGWPAAGCGSATLGSRQEKGQAKSPLMAGLGLYLLGWYGVARSEVYAIGQDRNTANVLFKDAVAMCRAPIPPGDDEADTLEARGDVVIRGEYDNAWKIEHPDSGSKFQSLANGEAISGPRPTAVLADEIHEFKSDSSIETWKRAIAKMPGDALMLLGTNTPATTQIIGTNYSEFYQKVAKGEHRDDEAFAFIARVDKADREHVFENEACWQKACRRSA
jgi:phage terminase large subunit-like protein